MRPPLSVYNVDGARFIALPRGDVQYVRYLKSVFTKVYEDSHGPLIPRDSLLIDQFSVR